MYGDQLDWLQDWDRNKQHGDVMFLKYEDMKDNTAQELRKIIKFLDINITEEHLNRVIEDVGIKKMKEDSCTNIRDSRLVVEGGNFIRSGQKGEWTKYFTPEQNQWFDEKYKEGYEKLGIDVVYE